MAAQNSEKGAVRGRPFQAGDDNRRNKGGRPKKNPEVMEMLKAACPSAVELLVRTMADEKAKPELRVQCANTIIDRVYGKPQQAVEVDAKNIPQVIFVGGDKIAD